MNNYSLICIANIILNQPKLSMEEKYNYHQNLYKEFIRLEQSRKELNQYIKENPPSL